MHFHEHVLVILALVTRKLLCVYAMVLDATVF